MALSDLLQGCSNKSDTVMIQQECYKVDDTRVVAIFLLSFVETPRKFIIAIINLRGVSTKLNKYIVFTMQTYKKLIVAILLHHDCYGLVGRTL